MNVKPDDYITLPVSDYDAMVEVLEQADRLYTTYGLMANSPECGSWIYKTREALRRVRG